MSPRRMRSSCNIGSLNFPPLRLGVIHHILSPLLPRFSSHLGVKCLLAFFLYFFISTLWEGNRTRKRYDNHLISHFMVKAYCYFPLALQMMMCLTSRVAQWVTLLPGSSRTTKRCWCAPELVHSWVTLNKSNNTNASELVIVSCGPRSAIFLQTFNPRDF